MGRLQETIKGRLQGTKGRLQETIKGRLYCKLRVDYRELRVDHRELRVDYIELRGLQGTKGRL